MSELFPGLETQTYSQYKKVKDITLPPKKMYYYSVTGDAVVGDNKSFSEFNYQNQRFQINEQLQNRTQGEAWGVQAKVPSVPRDKSSLYNIEELFKKYENPK
jgi:hypothetical protein